MKSTALLSGKFDSVLGEMLAVADDNGLYMLEFTDRMNINSELSVIEYETGKKIVPGTNSYIQSTKFQIEEYYEGKRKEFDIPLILTGTDFQKKIWRILQEIPFGATRSYKQQAIAYGNLKAIRAVAHANGVNKIAIIIPCHRVIGNNGNLTGYGGGIERKKWLLNHEMSQIIIQTHLEL